MAQYRSSSLLSILSQSQFDELQTGANRREVSKKEIILAEGDLNRSLFVIESGGVEILKSSQEGEEILGRLGTGNFFGELSVFNPGPVSATVRTAKKSHILVFDGDALQDYLERHPEMAMRFYSGLLKESAYRLRNMDQRYFDRIQYVANLLEYQCNDSFTEAKPVFREIGTEGNGLLDGLKDTDRENFLDLSENQSFQAEIELLKPGQSNSSLWFIHSGCVEVRLQSERLSQRLGILRQGAFFGEVSLFQPGPTTASVKTIEPTEVGRISKDTLELFASGRPAAGASVYRCLLVVLSKRIVAVTREFSKSAFEVWT